MGMARVADSVCRKYANYFFIGGWWGAATGFCPEDVIVVPMPKCTYIFTLAPLELKRGSTESTIIRDAEVTINIIFERSSQKGGVGKGFEKRVNRGPTLKFDCRPKAQENSFLESRIFIVVASSQEMQRQYFWTITPLSTLQGVGLGGRKNPRIIVGESSCHFGASYTSTANFLTICVWCRPIETGTQCFWHVILQEKDKWCG